MLYFFIITEQSYRKIFNHRYIQISFHYAGIGRGDVLKNLNLIQLKFATSLID
jgi:hypothetical protein